MKIIQIMQAPKGLVAVFNVMHEDGYYETAIEDVIAYGLYSTGRVAPLIIGEMGDLEPIESNFIRIRFEGGEDD